MYLPLQFHLRQHSEMVASVIPRQLHTLLHYTQYYKKLYTRDTNSRNYIYGKFNNIIIKNFLIKCMYNKKQILNLIEVLYHCVSFSISSSDYTRDATYSSYLIINLSNKCLRQDVIITF